MGENFGKRRIRNDIGFKLQSSVGLSVVQVPLGYMFKSYKFFWSQIFFNLLLTKFRKSYKHQALRDASCNLFSRLLLASSFSFANAVSSFSRKHFFPRGSKRQLSSFILVFAY